MKVWVRCARGVQVAYFTLHHTGCPVVSPSTWAKRVPRELIGKTNREKPFIYQNQWVPNNSFHQCENGLTTHAAPTTPKPKVV